MLIFPFDLLRFFARRHRGLRLYDRDSKTELIPKAR